MLTFASLVTVAEGCQRGERRIVAGKFVAEEVRRLARLVAGAVKPHETADGLGNRIITAAVAVRPVLTEAADRDVDDVVANAAKVIVSRNPSRASRPV